MKKRSVARFEIERHFAVLRSFVSVRAEHPKIYKIAARRVVIDKVKPVRTRQHDESTFLTRTYPSSS